MKKALMGLLLALTISAASAQTELKWFSPSQGNSLNLWLAATLKPLIDLHTKDSLQIVSLTKALTASNNTISLQAKQISKDSSSIVTLIAKVAALEKGKLVPGTGIVISGSTFSVATPDLSGITTRLDALEKRPVAPTAQQLALLLAEWITAANK